MPSGPITNAHDLPGGAIYLRLSVTDRCNLRCRYCMPQDGIALLPREEILRLEAMADLVFRLAQAVTIDKIRITGGEPLVRKGLPTLIEQLTTIPGQPALLLTTNGTLLAGTARILRQAGIARINISLDTLDRDRYRYLTGGDLDDVLAGIEAALSAGFEIVKLNTVLLDGVNDREIVALARFAFSRGLQIRYIELMPRGSRHPQDNPGFLPARTALDRLEQAFELTPVPQSGTTARMFRATAGSTRGMVGLITPISHPFCRDCRRLRLDARGRLFPCLMSDHQVDLLGTIASGIDDAELAALVRSWMEVKLAARSDLCSTPMSRIGG